MSSELTDALNRIILWLERNNQQWLIEYLKPGLFRSKIENYIKELPIQLPPEVYQLYQWRNGTIEGDFIRETDWIFNHLIFTNLKDAVAQYKKFNRFHQKNQIPPDLPIPPDIPGILRGKNKPTYTPYMDTGDFVIVVNAEKIQVTGRKRDQKLYRRHSGRPGGMKTETFAKLQARIPERIIEQAVRGMLPKNSLGRKLFTKLKVYAGSEHPHAAQKPQTITIETIPGGND